MKATLIPTYLVSTYFYIGKVNNVKFKLNEINFNVEYSQIQVIYFSQQQGRRVDTAVINLVEDLSLPFSTSDHAYQVMQLTCSIYDMQEPFSCHVVGYRYLNTTHSEMN